VVGSGGPGEFDADILDPAAIAFKDEILVYCSALGRQGDSIGLATSRDGITFQKAGRIMAGRAPSLVLRDNRLFMLSQDMVGDGYGLKLFSSTDGRLFAPVQSDPVLLPEPGSWDSLSVVTARMYGD